MPQAIASTLGREAFDLVVCCHVLEHTPAPMRAARNIETLLRPGGLAYISTPKVQAEQAIYFGETPVNSKACPIMNQLAAGSCQQYHANAPLAYFKQIHFWKTPIADCGNGKKNCMDYTQWQRAWTQLKG